jgi:hypothetical protein
MDWIIIARCDECNKEESFEVQGDRPPYEIGDHIDSCPCGGRMVVGEILELD